MGFNLLTLAMTLPRIAAAFIIVPLLTPEIVPSLVRNSLFVIFAVVVFPLVASSNSIDDISAFMWPFVVIKEIFIGAIFGLLFGSIFWAIGMAGSIVDTQVGTNMANAIDPLQGHQTSLSGVWLSRFASMLFMSSGGFMIFLDLLLSSYRLWPIEQSLPMMNLVDAEIFIGEFEYMMTAALLISAPAIMLLCLIDMVFGLVNRFSEQLNVLSISMPIKSWLGSFILLLNLGMIVELVMRKLGENSHLLGVLNKVLS